VITDKVRSPSQLSSKSDRSIKNFQNTNLDVADLGYESSFMEFLNLGLKLTFGYLQN